jgi:hypothetical protein
MSLFLFLFRIFLSNKTRFLTPTLSSERIRRTEAGSGERKFFSYYEIPGMGTNWNVIYSATFCLVLFTDKTFV